MQNQYFYETILGLMSSLGTSPKFGTLSQRLKTAYFRGFEEAMGNFCRYQETVVYYAVEFNGFEQTITIKHFRFQHQSSCL